MFHFHFTTASHDSINNSVSFNTLMMVIVCSPCACMHAPNRHIYPLTQQDAFSAFSLKPRRQSHSWHFAIQILASSNKRAVRSACQEYWGAERLLQRLVITSACWIHQEGKERAGMHAVITTWAPFYAFLHKSMHMHLWKNKMHVYHHATFTGKCVQMPLPQQQKHL